MHFSSRKRRRAPSVIIISLIDVLLVVLIFLMVSTTFRKEQPALKLVLPESKTALAGAVEGKPMRIAITSNAPYFFLEERPITLDRLQVQLTDAAQRDPQLKVSLRVDKRAPFGEFTKIMDAVKLAKVGALNIETEKPSRQ